MKPLEMILVVLLLGTYFFIGWFGGYDYCNRKPGCSYILYNNASPILGTGNISFKINHTYNITSYNCLNFSRDLKHRLDERNISSVLIDFKIKGYKTGHRVVGLLIEPQTGRLIPKHDYEYILIDNEE